MEWGRGGGAVQSKCMRVSELANVGKHVRRFGDPLPHKY